MSDGVALEIATMTADEVDLALAWAEREGWNPGLADAVCFRAADPDGFLVGRIDGVPVGTISAVRYGARLGFVGLYIVDPALRGRGLGVRLWDAAMLRLEGVTIGLDGVVAQQENYARSGFRLAHRTIRYGGPMVGHWRPGVVRLGPADLPQVAAYDEPCFGDARPGFLSAWLDQPRAVAAGVRSATGLAGYGVIRPSVEGWKVGPLFADDADVAADLLSSLAAHAGAGATVFLDVPEPHRAAVALACSHGMAPVFETARMYRGDDPGLPLSRVFGITSFELG